MEHRNVAISALITDEDSGAAAEERWLLGCVDAGLLEMGVRQTDDTIQVVYQYTEAAETFVRMFLDAQGLVPAPRAA